MIKKITLLLLLIFTKQGFGQIPIYQDIFHGGVTGDAYNPWLSPASAQVDIFIEPGSSIRKALLFVSSYFNPKDEGTIYFEGVPLSISPIHSINEPYFYKSGNDIREIQTLLLDVTDLVNPTQNTYSISVVQPNTGGRYVEFYLYVAYENTSLDKVCVLVTANDAQPAPTMDFSFMNMNPMDTTENIGLALHTSNFCDTIEDGSYVLIENDTIGLVGGDDDHSLVSCNGVIGSFYYQNNTLFGLANDIPNNSMEATDAIASIEPYLISKNSINVSFQYQSNFRPFSNTINQLFLTYTSPCDTFSTTLTPDTTICYGETLQLQATGGVSTGSNTGYEWTAISDSAAIDDLSCTDCPNPVFTGDKSQVYTVRIWNSDSCSVVKPVRIGVSQPQKLNAKMFRSICSFSTGKIVLEDLPNNLFQLGAVNPIGDTLSPNSSNNFTGLSAGDHTVFYIDEFGCSNDTVIYVEPIISTVAQFNAYPKKGTAPIQINLTNQSQNATDYSWWLNGEYQGNAFSGFYTDTSGVYDIALIAWRNDSICADTATFTILVFDSLVAQLPNVFTPNNDGTNDFFNVKVNLPVSYKLSILNRWGNVVFENEGGLVEGTHDLWNGRLQSGEKVTDGTYFYTISFALDNETVDCEVTECEVRKDGFVQIFGE